MNFLAHAYLSFNDGEILTGNLMADFIRGKPLPELPPQIRKGIMLHREIDDFTDHHAVNHEAYKFFRASSGRFAPVFLDIAYDYFLANYKPAFPSQESLELFAEQTYQSIKLNLDHTGEKFQSMFNSMSDQNWLARYNRHESIARSFHSVTFRTKHITDTQPVFDEFLKYENELKSAFEAFFPDLENHVKKMLFRVD